MTELRGKSILVTGATGFIGSRVARRLLREGGCVRAIVRSAARAAPLAAEGADIVEGDLTDAASLRHAVQGCQVVFHFAAILADDSRPRSDFWSVNVEGTRALAEAALEAGVERFIHVSSTWAYGMDAGLNTDETSPRRPSGVPYVDTKLEGENVIRQLVRERGLPAVIVQPSDVYGPGDETWTLQPIRMIKAGTMMLPAGGRGLVQPVFVDDLVEGVLAAARRGRAGEAYILCGSQAVTIREFFGYYARMVGRERLPSVPEWTALAVATVSGWMSKVTHQPPLATKEAVRGLLKHASFKGDKARRDLGFVPSTSLEEGMRLVEGWLRREGYIADRGGAGIR